MQKLIFSGITNIIDALGGVEVDSPYEFTTLHGNYKIKKGVNELNGDQALCFVRERYALPSGDFDRGKNQQRLLKAMLKKAMSPKIITNYSNILAAVEGSFETDMSSDDIKSLVNMQLDDMAGWKIKQISVSGTGGSDWTPANGFNAYVAYPDMDSVHEAVEMMRKNRKKMKSIEMKK